MMQRLDNAMREGRNTGDLSRKVDVSLKQETQAFFAKVANSNARKWNQLVQRCEHDVELILREAQDKGLYQPNTTAPPAKKTKYTTHDLEMEELRLEEDYNRNWMRHEGFHLQEAFRSQQNKLDREWDVYTEQLHDAVNEKKKSILGNNYAMHMEKLNLGRSGGNATKDNSDTAERFHHPEKQKSLIHTAPVLSPVLDTGKPRVAAGSAMRAVRNGKEDAVIQSEVFYYICGLVLCMYLILMNMSSVCSRCRFISLTSSWRLLWPVWRPKKFMLPNGCTSKTSELWCRRRRVWWRDCPWQTTSGYY